MFASVLKVNIVPNEKVLGPPTMPVDPRLVVEERLEPLEPHRRLLIRHVDDAVGEVRNVEQNLLTGPRVREDQRVRGSEDRFALGKLLEAQMVSVLKELDCLDGRQTAQASALVIR